MPERNVLNVSRFEQAQNLLGQAAVEYDSQEDVYVITDIVGDLELPDLPRYICRFSEEDLYEWDDELQGVTELLAYETEDEVLDMINETLDTFLEFYLEIYDLDEGRLVPWKVHREIELLDARPVEPATA